jgi:hypothetical protein
MIEINDEAMPLQLRRIAHEVADCAPVYLRDQIEDWIRRHEGPATELLKTYQQNRALYNELVARHVAVAKALQGERAPARVSTEKVTDKELLGKHLERLRNLLLLHRDLLAMKSEVVDDIVAAYKNSGFVESELLESVRGHRDRSIAKQKELRLCLERISSAISIVEQQADLPASPPSRPIA